jgi:hypothetical protein
VILGITAGCQPRPRRIRAPRRSASSAQMYASTLASGTAPTSASATFSPAYNSKSPTAQFSHVSRHCSWPSRSTNYTSSPIRNSSDSTPCPSPGSTGDANPHHNCPDYLHRRGSTERCCTATRKLSVGGRRRLVRRCETRRTLDGHDDVRRWQIRQPASARRWAPPVVIAIMDDVAPERAVVANLLTAGGSVGPEHSAAIGLRKNDTSLRKPQMTSREKTCVAAVQRIGI